jgi:hypothetical protein
MAIDEEYLGDASYDGWQFYLRAPRGDGIDHWVGLDMDVYAAFNLYAAKKLREKEEAFLKQQRLNRS